jgi:hypothetical protein
MVTRVAMWSGPRNISTAMMRSFGARPATVVLDEPLYAYYLHRTGLDHPGRAAILAAQPTDWRDVAADLAGPVPDGVELQYAKHMTHHLLPEVELDWLADFRHAYLVRSPAHVVASYAKVRGEPTPEDLGYARQAEIHAAFPGPVVDAADVLRDPPGVLAQLCEALGIRFDPAMLSWPPGPAAEDGVWAPYWYSQVEVSTGFAPYDPRPAEVPARLEPLVKAVQPYYDELAAHRLR